MVRSVLYLQPRGGDHQAIVDFYRHNEILERAARQEGCLGAELELPVEEGAPVLVTAVWRDAAAYDGWVANPERAATAGGLAELVEGDFDAGVRGGLYEVVLAVGERNATVQA